MSAFLPSLKLDDEAEEVVQSSIPGQSSVDSLPPDLRHFQKQKTFNRKRKNKDLLRGRESNQSGSLDESVGHLSADSFPLSQRRFQRRTNKKLQLKDTQYELRRYNKKRAFEYLFYSKTSDACFSLAARLDLLVPRQLPISSMPKSILLSLLWPTLMCNQEA